MPVLLMAVLDKPQQLWEVLDAWQALGMHDATIVDSTGLYRLQQMRDDLPLFPSVHDLLESTTNYHRTIWSVVADSVDLDEVVRATEKIVGPLDKPHAGLIVAIPITRVWGLRPSG